MKTRDHTQQRSNRKAPGVVQEFVIIMSPKKLRLWPILCLNTHIFVTVITVLNRRQVFDITLIQEAGTYNLQPIIESTNDHRARASTHFLAYILYSSAHMIQFGTDILDDRQ